MIPHLRGREDALEPFGWNPEDTAWVAMVCLNSGVFTRGQYSAFFRTHRVRAHRFVQSLVDLKLALEEPIPVISPQNRATACRITYKGIYRALEIPNVRHRRAGDPAVYLRRLLSLDYVIEHPQLEWLPTEDEKVEFCTHYGVPHDRLPYRIYSGAAGKVIRYFPLKLPVAGGPVCTFVYVDPGNDTATELRHWGQAHEHVWTLLRKRGFKIHVAAVAINPDADERARNVLDEWARDREGVRAGSWREEELREEYTAVSRAIEHPDPKTLERYGGFHQASRRYIELKDLLSKPLLYHIRIDTFEIWRSRRIFPDGASFYQNLT